MGVRESLTLDHFYFNVSDSEFEDLLKLKDLFRACRHEKTATTTDSWEGLYLYSRPWSYLEILRERRAPGFFAICLSPWKPYLCDAAQITNEIESEWHTYNRILADGTPWFDALYLKKVENDHESLFQAWIMKYHPRHVTAALPISPRSVDRFQRITLELGKENASEILSQCAFLPTAPILSEDEIRLQIPDRDGFLFEVVIELKAGGTRFNFKALTFDHCDPERFSVPPNVELKHFQLNLDGRRFTLTRTGP